MSGSRNEDVLDALAKEVVRRAAHKSPFIVGLTGSVAAGKTTLCRALADRLAGDVAVEAVSTDGFLFPNDDLNRRGLSLRKGYPETYDEAALFGALDEVRRGAVVFPGYSHAIYDVDPGLNQIIDRADVVLIEGLAFSPFADGRSLADEVDLMIYLDATEANLEQWFIERFMEYWRSAEDDAVSFYRQFRGMTEDQAASFAAGVWRQINLPNLRDHIVRTRDRAHILIRKAAGHELELVRSR